MVLMDKDKVDVKTDRTSLMHFYGRPM